MLQGGETFVDPARWEALRQSLLDDDAEDDPGDDGAACAEVPEVLADMVGRYAGTGLERVALLRDACARRDAEEAAGVMHTIKGSNAMIGAVRVESVAGEAEARLRRGEPVGPWLEDAVSELEASVAETALVLRRLVERAQPSS